MLDSVPNKSSDFPCPIAQGCGRLSSSRPSLPLPVVGIWRKRDRTDKAKKKRGEIRWTHASGEGWSAKGMCSPNVRMWIRGRSSTGSARRSSVWTPRPTAARSGGPPIGRGIPSAPCRARSAAGRTSAASALWSGVRTRSPSVSSSVRPPSPAGLRAGRSTRHAVACAGRPTTSASGTVGLRSGARAAPSRGDGR